MFSRDLGFHYLVKDLKQANTRTLLFDLDFINTLTLLEKEFDINFEGYTGNLATYKVNDYSYLYVSLSSNIDFNFINEAIWQNIYIFGNNTISKHLRFRRVFVTN